jgi:hypothetical protein
MPTESSATSRARLTGPGTRVPVIWVQHSDKDLIARAQSGRVPELIPHKGEPLIHKHFESSFEQTALEEELAKVGATHIALAGAATNWCIPRHGLRRTGTWLRPDVDQQCAHHAHNGTRQRGQVEATGVINDLNVAMTWLSYPGRRNGTAKAEGSRLQRLRAPKPAFATTDWPEPSPCRAVDSASG